MDPHLEHVPRLTALAARGLAGRDLERLGRQAHGALDAQVLGLGALEELGAHLFERGHFARGEGDADFVDFLGEWRRIVSMVDRIDEREGGILGRRQSLSRASGKTFSRVVGVRWIGDARLGVEKLGDLSANHDLNNEAR